MSEKQLGVNDDPEVISYNFENGMKILVVVTVTQYKLLKRNLMFSLE